MKTILVLATLTSGFLASAASARQEECNVPMIEWQTRASVQTMAEAQGWTVRRIKTDDGCYEVYARDQSGRPIEVKIDPATLAIVEIEFEAEHRDERHDNEPDEAGHLPDDDAGSDD